MQCIIFIHLNCIIFKVLQFKNKNYNSLYFYLLAPNCFIPLHNTKYNSIEVGKSHTHHATIIL